MMFTYDFVGLADGGVILFPDYCFPAKPIEFVIETIQLTGNNTNSNNSISAIADQNE